MGGFLYSEGHSGDICPLRNEKVVLSVLLILRYNISILMGMVPCRMTTALSKRREGFLRIWKRSEFFAITRKTNQKKRHTNKQKNYISYTLPTIFNNKQRNRFWKSDFPSPQLSFRLTESKLNSTGPVSQLSKTLLRHFSLLFSSICHPSFLPNKYFWHLLTSFD